MAETDLRPFAARVVIVLGIAAAMAILWTVSDVLVLAFGGILMATALRALSDPLARRSSLSPRLALATVLVALVAVTAGVGLVLGERLTQEAGQLLKMVPEAIGKARTWAQGSPLGQILLHTLGGTGKQSLAGLAGFASGTFGMLAELLVVLFLGIYFAVDPELYRRGALRLVPHSARKRTDAALVAVGQALRNWLRGQLVSMAVVGVITGVGLWLMGVRLALSLGVVAGLMEFIPFVGPFLAAIPAILVGFAQGPTGALWVAVFYLGIHQLEGNILMPLVQRWAVSLPPALAVAAVVVFGLLFGLFGVLFATPLMIVVMVFIRKLYVEPVIDEAPP